MEAEILSSLPPIAIDWTTPPYDFTPLLKGMAQWLGSSVLAALSEEADRAEFWMRYRDILSIWDDVPFLVDGEAWPFEQRRHVRRALVIVIYSVGRLLTWPFQLLIEHLEGVERDIQTLRMVVKDERVEHDENWRRHMSLTKHRRIKASIKLEPP